MKKTSLQAGYVEGRANCSQDVCISLLSSQGSSSPTIANTTNSSISCDIDIDSIPKNTFTPIQFLADEFTDPLLKDIDQWLLHLQKIASRQYQANISSSVQELKDTSCLKLQQAQSSLQRSATVASSCEYDSELASTPPLESDVFRWDFKDSYIKGDGNSNVIIKQCDTTAQHQNNKQVLPLQCRSSLLKPLVRKNQGQPQVQFTQHNHLVGNLQETQVQNEKLLTAREHSSTQNQSYSEQMQLKQSNVLSLYQHFLSNTGEFSNWERRKRTKLSNECQPQSDVQNQQSYQYKCGEHKSETCRHSVPVNQRKQVPNQSIHYQIAIDNPRGDLLQEVKDLDSAYISDSDKYQLTDIECWENMCDPFDDNILEETIDYCNDDAPSNIVDQVCGNIIEGDFTATDSMQTCTKLCSFNETSSCNDICKLTSSNPSSHGSRDNTESPLSPLAAASISAANSAWGYPSMRFSSTVPNQQFHCNQVKQHETSEQLAQPSRNTCQRQGLQNESRALIRDSDAVTKIKNSQMTQNQVTPFVFSNSLRHRLQLQMKTMPRESVLKFFLLIQSKAPNAVTRLASRKAIVNFRLIPADTVRQLISIAEKEMKLHKLTTTPRFGRRNGFKVCDSCHTTTTPVWREVNSHYFCNACGLRYKKLKVRCANIRCRYVPRSLDINKPCKHCGTLLPNLEVMDRFRIISQSMKETTSPAEFAQLQGCLNCSKSKSET